jgi:hypothetical protein
MLQRKLGLVNMFPPKQTTRAVRDMEVFPKVITDEGGSAETFSEDEFMRSMHAGFDERTLGESRKSSWPRTIRDAMKREDKDL